MFRFGFHHQPLAGSYRSCISPSGEWARNTAMGNVVQGLVSIIPCIFHPAGMMSVAAGTLLSVGSLMVAVSVEPGSGIALTYVAFWVGLDAAGMANAVPVNREAAATACAHIWPVFF